MELLQRQKLSNAQLSALLLLSKQNYKWRQNTSVWFLWSSPEFPVQRGCSLKNASLRSDGIQPLPHRMSFSSSMWWELPGAVVITSLGAGQLELAKGVPIILALTSLFEGGVCLGFFNGTNISSIYFELMLLLRAALRKLRARLRVRYSR